MESIAQKLRRQPDFNFLELEIEIQSDDDEQGFGSMVKALEQNKTVRYIYLCGEFFDCLDGGQRRLLLKAIANLETLQSIYVANATLSFDSVYDLANMFLTCKGALREVSFQHLHIPKGVTLSAIVYAVASLPLVEKVDIGILFMYHTAAAFSKESLAKLCQSSSLQVLTLVDLRLDQDHFWAMARELAIKSTLKELHIWGEYLSQKCCSSIACMLEVNRSLQTICLYFARIENDGLKDVAESIGRNSTLKTFSIENEGDSITKEGVIAISCMMETNTQLESLSITSKGLEDEGCVRICQALRHHPSLKHLSLDNGIDDEADEITYTNTSKQKESMVTEVGILALANMLEETTGIERLDLSGLAVDVAGVESLASALHSNSTLQELTLGSISQERIVKEGKGLIEKERVFKALAEMLEHNHVIGKILIEDKEEDEVGVHQGKTNLLLTLNQLGLRTLMVDVNSTREAFVKTLAGRTIDLDCVYYMLSMNPSCIG